MEIYKNLGTLYSLNFMGEVIEHQITGVLKNGYYVTNHNRRINKKTLISENPFNGSEKKQFYKRNPKIKIHFTS